MLCIEAGVLVQGRLSQVASRFLFHTRYFEDILEMNSKKRIYMVMGIESRY